MKIIPIIIINLLIIFFLNKFRFNISKKLQLIDIPDKIRKFHKKNTPLLGGIMIYSSLVLLNIYTFILNEYNKISLIIFICSSFYFLVGLIDDVFKIAYKYKFIFLSFFLYFIMFFQPELQITKIYFSTFDKYIYFEEYSILFTVICIMLLSNAINLIDGINGLCIFISIIILSWILLTFKNTDNISIIIISLFFIFFFNLKGYVFLGDSGSLLLGSLISLLIIDNYNNEILLTNFPVENIFIILMFPGIDMLRVFLERIFKKKNPFLADRNHLHHLLLDRSIKLNKVLIIITSIVLFPILLNQFTLIEPFKIILIYFLTYFILIYCIKKSY